MATKAKKEDKAVAEKLYFSKNVVALAEELYTNRKIENMPMIADALRDDGNEAYADHFLSQWREEKDEKGSPCGICPKGCYELDMILGKE